MSERVDGPRIWLKSDDCTGSVFSGNKIRKLEFLMADAKTNGADVILTCGGIQSNHCRATATVAAQLGMECHLLLRGPTSLPEADKSFNPREIYQDGFEGNLLLDDLLSARISVYAPAYYAASLDQLFAEWEEQYAAQGKKAYSIPTGGSNALGLWGYIAAAEELCQDLKTQSINSAAVICASGSGGTQGGLTLGMHLLKAQHKVTGFAVCDSEKYFAEKIKADVQAWQRQFRPGDDIASSLSTVTDDRYIGPGYALGYPELFQCIRDVARLEGVILDPVYTGKAFHGMLDAIKSGAFADHEDIVFVHTGGLFGLFPYKRSFV